MIGEYDSGDFAGEMDEQREDERNWFYLKRDMEDGISPWANGFDEGENE